MSPEAIHCPHPDRYDRGECCGGACPDEDFPADIIEAAERAVEATSGTYCICPECIKPVARAIMAERERCAQIVEDHEEYTVLRTGYRGLSRRSDGNLVGLAYAAAIRSHPKKLPAGEAS